MRAKIIATSLTVAGLFLLFVSVLTYVGFFNKSNAGILIDSNLKANVFINNREVGVTPYESQLKPGEIIVKIKPVVNGNEVLDDYETKINLISGVQTIIKRDFKQKEIDSSGVIVSFEKDGSNDSSIAVVSIPGGAKVEIDNKFVGYTPFEFDISAGNHEVKISYRNYEEMKLPIVVYKGYKLTAFIKLAGLKKVEATNQVGVEEQGLGIKEIKTKIKIKNKYSFVSVKSGASFGFPEVGQIVQGEEYEVIESGEKGKWYKISFEDKEGWVSAGMVEVVYLPVNN